MSKPKRFQLRSSSITNFKACPTRFRLANREGIRAVEDTEAQRMGTNWGGLHEVYQNAYRDAAAALQEQVDAGHAGDDTIPEQAHEAGLEAAIEHLNTRYAEVPASKTPEEWAIERQILITSFIGYLWYWQDDPFTPVASEATFDLPLHAPQTGLPMPLSQVIRQGMIDHIVVWQGRLVNVERKSTSKNIEPEGTYWEKAQKDTQVSMYALAFRDMLESGTLPDAVAAFIEQNSPEFGNTLYDVWHRPKVKPSKLSQKDTDSFIESGEYCGQNFEVTAEPHQDENGDTVYNIRVDGEEAEVEMGKSGKPAVRETVGMFGARLLADIQERPAYYFQRREIARTDRDLARFRVELANIYQAMRNFDRSGCWYENEQQCRATFPCEFIPICYGPGADAVCSGEVDLPDGFKRVPVELTREQQRIQEDG